jgi:hypothetical protein
MSAPSDSRGGGATTPEPEKPSRISELYAPQVAKVMKFFSLGALIALFAAVAIAGVIISAVREDKKQAEVQKTVETRPVPDKKGIVYLNSGRKMEMLPLTGEATKLICVSDAFGIRTGPEDGEDGYKVFNAETGELILERKAGVKAKNQLPEPTRDRPLIFWLVGTGKTPGHVATVYLQ